MQTTLKLFFVLSVVALFTSCGVKVLETTSQKWHGGIPQAGYGTYYTVKLVSPADAANIEFIALWEENNYAPNPVVFDEKMNKTASFKKGQTIIVRFKHHIKTDKEGTPIKAENVLEEPYVYKKQAIMSYKLNGKQKYVDISEIKKLEPQNRP